MVYYEGLFFDKDEVNKILALEDNRLEIGIDIIHCTFKYLPNSDEVFNELVGRYFEIDILGYGSNETNSGFCIRLPRELEEYYINTDKFGNCILPHITCSKSIDGESENTKNLMFSYFDETIRVKCRFGYCIKDINGKIFVSYDKF